MREDYKEVPHFNPHLPSGRRLYLNEVINLEEYISIPTFLAEDDKYIVIHETDNFNISIPTFLAEDDTTGGAARESGD